MSIVRITDFQKVYPRLWETINRVRIQSGFQHLSKDYSEYFCIPIKMYDAALAESFLEKESNYLIDPRVALGYSNLQKILKVVREEPNMFRWLDILYYPNNPKGLFTGQYKTQLKIKKTKTIKKESTMAKVRNQVEGEIIVEVVQGETSLTAIGLDGIDYTNQINQKKLKYAFENRGVVRGRKNDSGDIVWRVVKEKYIKRPEEVDSTKFETIVSAQPTQPLV